MQTRQVVALVIVVAIIALALGVTMGYSLSSGRITTYQATKLRKHRGYKHNIKRVAS
jgi:hypothetical protein